MAIPKSKILGSPHLGRAASVDEKSVTFTFGELLGIVKFDLNNAYFRIGDTILQQRVGIPMGSPLSPALAQIVCAWYETKTIENMRREGALNEVEGVRYVDDLTCFIFYDKSSIDDKDRALEIARQIQFGYHENTESSPPLRHGR